MARWHMGATWIDPEELAYNTPGGRPSNSNRRGLVRFPDDSLQIVKLGVPDTYFSIPAKPSTGRIGYVAVEGTEFHFYPPTGRARRRPAARTARRRTTRRR